MSKWQLFFVILCFYPYLKSIQKYFVYLDVAPIIALQILEYKKLIDLINHPNVILSDAPMMNISSSSIREKIRHNEDYESLISENIKKFVISRGIYS